MYRKKFQELGKTVAYFVKCTMDGSHCKDFKFKLKFSTLKIAKWPLLIQTGKIRCISWLEREFTMPGYILYEIMFLVPISIHSHDKTYPYKIIVIRTTSACLGQVTKMRRIEPTLSRQNSTDNMYDAWLLYYCIQRNNVMHDSDYHIQQETNLSHIFLRSIN